MVKCFQDSRPESGERDEFVVEVNPGSQLRVEVFADRWGSPLDAVLDVTTEDGVTSALTYVSSSQTGGSYDSGTGLWSFASLDAGGADTLRVLLEVTDGTPATIPLIAESLGLTLEVDSNPGNDVATVNLGVS